MSLLETKNIVKKYGSRTVVNGVSLQVNTGVVVGLLGPNGAGKTTSFYSIAGFIRPNQGNILLDGEVITNLPIHKRALKGISYLAQEPSVFKKLTVEENIRIVLEPLGLTSNEINNRIDELLVDLQIEYLRNNKGHALSEESADELKSCGRWQHGRASSFWTNRLPESIPLRLENCKESSIL